MVPVLSLCLPILLSAVAVFILSSIVNTVLPYHRSDYAPVPNEDAVMDALRPFNIPPGDYLLPRPKSMKDMNTPEYQEKWKRGPVATFTMMKHQNFGMASQLVSWFIYVVIVNTFAAYITGSALGPGAEYRQVFRFVSTTAALGYGGALWQQTIWYQKKLSTTLKGTFDALLYGLVTAGFFGWLWPR